MFKTEAAAWREVARQLVEERGYVGLCDMVAYLEAYDSIGAETYYGMKDRLKGALGASVWAYPTGVNPPLFTYYDDHREARCLAALWFALEAEEERA